MQNTTHNGQPEALVMLAAERPRNVSWIQSAGLLFGDWGTSRLYVLGFAFLVAGRTSFWLVCAMSLLILIVAWAYTQICRIYADGGGVYTAARHFHPLLGVVGALLLFADYTVTASLSALEAFKYFGLNDAPAHVAQAETIMPAVEMKDAGSYVSLHGERDEGTVVDQDKIPAGATPEAEPERIAWTWKSPATWAVISIVLIGALNLLGPKHSAGPAIVAAIGMILITLVIVLFALPQIDYHKLDLGRLNQHPLRMWEAFVAIVLALSGVEAIANLTGVMKRPVYKTASRAIWIVALEVAIFNILLAVVMCSIVPLSRDGHTGDMLAYMARVYAPWAEWPVRIIAGVLLLSATNTAVGALMGTVYIMSRDNELPALFQKLNAFGAPWVGAIVAAAVPSTVLFFVSNLEELGHLYAIGIVGAVAINCTLCAFHPRLRKFYRKGPMIFIGVLLMAIWVTLAYTKVHALIFVCVIMIIGLTLRQITRYAASKRPKPSLLRRAIMEQLTPEALEKPKMLLATAGSDAMAETACQLAASEDAALVVVFVREVALNVLVQSAESRMTLDTDPAAVELFISFLAIGHKYGVPIIPMYDTGTSSPEMIAEHAAMNGVTRILIGSSRRGAIHQIIKGNFQRRLEALLPPEIPVRVMTANEPEPVHS